MRIPDIMKLRPLFVLLLFAVSAAVLGWIYYAATHEHPERHTSPWVETLGDLDACGRRKHVKSIQYEHFASIADEESRSDVSRLFRALAQAERVQENNCANAIVQLGGHYIPPGRVVVFRGTTDGNLERSIAYERQSLHDLGDEEIRRALARSNRYAARVLVWNMAGDLREVLLLERCRNTATPAGYLVCPRCGNIYVLEESDPFCPCCMTERPRFIRFE